MGYVLTEDVYVSKLFTQQKTELKFDNNDDFLLFLLNNTYTVSSIVKKLSTISDRVIDLPKKSYKANRQPTHANVKNILQSVYQNECRKEEFRKADTEHGTSPDTSPQPEVIRKGEGIRVKLDPAPATVYEIRRAESTDIPLGGVTTGKIAVRKDPEILCARIVQQEPSADGTVPSTSVALITRTNPADHQKAFIRAIPSRVDLDTSGGGGSSSSNNNTTSSSGPSHFYTRDDKLRIRNVTRANATPEPSPRNTYVYDPLILQKSNAVLQEAAKVINQTKPELGLGLRRNKIVERPRPIALDTKDRSYVQTNPPSRAELESYKDTTTPNPSTTPPTSKNPEDSTSSSSSSSSDNSHSAPGSPQFRTTGTPQHSPTSPPTTSSLTPPVHHTSPQGPTTPAPHQTEEMTSAVAREETVEDDEEEGGSASQWQEDADRRHVPAATLRTSSFYPRGPPGDTDHHNTENQDKNNELSGQDKLYICPICNKEFKGSGRVRNCKIHVNTVHLKHKPYKCNFCNVRFGYKDYMKRHLIRHHKSVFYSYGAESALEKYTTYETESTAEPHQSPHEDKY